MINNSSQHWLDEISTSISNIYEPLGFQITKTIYAEDHSIEYFACQFALNSHEVVFRMAKTTPKKLGQFVTLWKRHANKKDIVPFDYNDEISFVIISASNKTNSGHFIFGKELLLDKKIMSYNNLGGKRAIRVYPPWVKPTSPQAIKTQKWQAPHFLPITKQGNTNQLLVQKLFTKLS